jgi:hypothetical protein
MTARVVPAEVGDVNEEVGAGATQAGFLESWFGDDVPEMH